MNKILILVLLSSVVVGTADIDYVRVYVEDEKVSADEDGGRIKVEPGDVVEVHVNVDNQYNVTTEAKLRGVIEYINDGNDIEEEQDWYDIDDFDDKKKILSFTIPSDAKEDEFDMELRVYHRWNGTTKDWKIDYEVSVVKDEEESKVDYREYFYNLTYVCKDLVTDMSHCYGYLNMSRECYSNLSTCYEQRGTCNEDLAEAKSTRDQYKEDNDDKDDECQTKINDKDDEIRRLQNEKRNMISSQQCENRTVERLNREEAGGGGWWWLLIVGGGIAWYLKNKKEKMLSVGDGMQYDWKKS